MCSNLLQPCITEPTRIVSRNKPSLVNNIFMKKAGKNRYSGNILDKKMDHLPKFITTENLTIKPL